MKREHRLYYQIPVVLLESRRIENGMVRAVNVHGDRKVFEIPLTIWSRLPPLGALDLLQGVLDEANKFADQGVLQYPWVIQSAVEPEHEFLRLTCLREGVGYVSLDPFVLTQDPQAAWYRSNPALEEGMIPVSPAAVAALLEIRYREAAASTGTPSGEPAEASR